MQLWYLTTLSGIGLFWWKNVVKLVNKEVGCFLCLLDQYGFGVDSWAFFSVFHMFGNVCTFVSGVTRWWCVRLKWRPKRNVRLIRRSLLRSWIRRHEQDWLDWRKRLTRKSQQLHFHVFLTPTIDSLGNILFKTVPLFCLSWNSGFVLSLQITCF